MPDYAEFQTQDPEECGDSLSKISMLADELLRTQEAAEELEKHLAAVRARADQISQVLIPELMQECGLQSFKTTSGSKIELHDDVFASITEENKDAAFDWLDQNGHGGMIKRKVEVMFNRDQQEAARKLEADLRKEFPNVTEKGDIHAQTLKAWVRNRLKAGEKIPQAISYFQKKVAKIK